MGKKIPEIIPIIAQIKKMLDEANSFKTLEDIDKQFEKLIKIINEIL